MYEDDLRDKLIGIVDKFVDKTISDNVYDSKTPLKMESMQGCNFEIRRDIFT